MNRMQSGLFCVGMLLASIGAEAKQVIAIDLVEGADMTPIVRAALEGASDSDVKVVFSKGVYSFRPDYAAEQYCYITNHGNGLKKIAFPLEGFDSIEIEGNGAEFIFHGQIAPFRFED